MKKSDGLIGVILLLIATGLLWPMVNNLDNQIINNYDGQLSAWIQVTLIEKILSLNWHNFFSAPIFYPYPFALTFSDLFLPSAVLTLPIWLLTHNPIAVINTATYLALSLTLITLYCLLKEITQDKLASLVMTLVFGTSALYTPYWSHIQNGNLAGLMIALLALVKLSQKWQLKWLLIWAGAFFLQFTNNFLTGVMLFLASVIYIGFSPNLRQKARLHWRPGLMIVCLTIIALLPFILPYFRTAKFYQSYRPITDVMHFSVSVNDYWGKYFSPLLWLALGVGLWGLRKKGFQVTKVTPWLVIALTGLVMTLGPALKWAGQSVKIPFHIPLPYLFFYYLVPGFKGFRAPDRFLVMAAVGLTAAAAMGLTKLPIKIKWGVLMVIFGLWLITWPRLKTQATADYNQVPAVYSFLQNQPGEGVMELPIFRWGSDEFSRNETSRMLWQLKHQKKLVNGYSGYSPPLWEDRVARLQREFPSPILLAELKQIPIDYLIIHFDEYEKWRGRAKAEEIEKYMDQSGYKMIFQDATVRVYDMN